MFKTSNHAAEPPAWLRGATGDLIRSQSHRGRCGRRGCNVTDMAGAAGMPGWREVETGAPEIARPGAARLSAARIALLGTLRRDGSPPVKPYLVNGRLLVGAMTWSGEGSRHPPGPAVRAAQ